jgi:hypothetical protein
MQRERDVVFVINGELSDSETKTSDGAVIINGENICERGFFRKSYRKVCC